MIIIKQLMTRKIIFTVLLCFLIYIAAIITMIQELNAAIIILLTIQLLAALHDIYDRTIPYPLTLIALAAGIFINAVFYEDNTASNFILGSIAAFLTMKILVVVSKGQLGGGDLALMTVTGLFLGLARFFNILLFSFILAGAYSIILIAIKKAGRKTEIPFAPFILMATTITVMLKA